MAPIDQEYDLIGVAVAAAVLLALPIFDSSADVFAGLVGGAVGGLAGLAASALRDHDLTCLDPARVQRFSTYQSDNALHPPGGG